jgi:hypothetical protein
MNLDRLWIHSVIRLMDEELAIEDMGRILERCGQGCAYGCGMIEKIQKAQMNYDKPDEVFKKLQSPDIFGDRIMKGEDCYYTICEQCFCPFVSENLSEIPASYCECTKGWTKTVFQTAFGRSVNVEIEQTILRGGECCRMKITFCD